MGLIKKFLKRIRFFSEPKSHAEKPIFYTKDIFKDKSYKIGDYTYGKPIILFDDQETNLEIGKFCSIANNVNIFLGGNHRMDWVTTYPFNILNEDFPASVNIEGHPSTKGDVIIGNDVWIGNNVTIMSGVKIGDGAVIGTGAVITKNIESYEVWAGNPAKLIKKRFSEEVIQKLLDMKWWNWEIEKINENVVDLCSVVTNDNPIFFKNKK